MPGNRDFGLQLEPEPRTPVSPGRSHSDVLTGHSDNQTLHHPDSRDDDTRLVDDLELLRIERMVSHDEKEEGSRMSKSLNRRHQPDPEDAFLELTQAAPLPEIKPAAASTTFLSRLWIRVKKFPRVIRYFVYALPVGALLLTPILLDIFAIPGDNPVGGPGGLKLLWFGIWLEVVWSSFWATRILVALMPLLFGNIAKVCGSTNHKKWKDIGRQMEMPTALFIWMLALLVSYNPVTDPDDHRSTSTGDWSDGQPDITWISIIYKVIIALFVLAVSNWLEKILIQWIAMSFHLRTYAFRIEQNKAETNFLIQLYEYSKPRLAQEDDAWLNGNGGASGTRTPLKKVQNHVGKIANKVAGDFTGRKILGNDHPRKVVLELLRNTSSSHTLARNIYRALIRPGEENIVPSDMNPVFGDADDAEACFGMFDKDLNGDISMEELETVCNDSKC